MAIDVYGPAINTICKNILINLNSEDIEEAISDTFLSFGKISIILTRRKINH